MYTRRHILASTIAAPAILRFGIGTAQAATTIKISHQFPGGSIDSGDFLTPDSSVMLAAWYSAFGGDDPRSLMDLKTSGACLDSFRWLLLARKKLESRVEREMRERA